MHPAPSSKNKYFFSETNELHDEIISLHDFVLPAATALWNFRAVIEEEFEKNSVVSVSDLAHKYNTAPGTRGSTNLITPFRTHTWEMQRDRLSEVALVNIIALYEIWCERICQIFGNSDLAIKMQFPSGVTAVNGVLFAINQLQATGSVAISNSIQPSLRQSKKYSLVSINNLLKCYRYFKELRNCLMHRGRRCDGKLWGAQSEFKPVATEAALGMKFVPEHFTALQGQEVQLSFHGVLGFTDVILRIATTIDAEIAATPEGERIVIERIRENAQIPIKADRLPNLFATIGWNGTSLTPELIDLLRTSGVVANV
ncbi:hypothetical protein E2C06_18135 [Dankookia rubra]|uniref:Uncharacterized protein n=1 Tax=Dankookia rubra TaxID=1442381 RepID=A0A4R5QEQ5_9PROT|nr:hypothetical protein [Dankookia rubra]TDH61159.1 hypothetical protein E2C06_18135 [Dankookia rubra]